MFDPGRLLGVRMGNLNECERKHTGKSYSWEPFFLFIEQGCLVKTFLAKTLLREKRPGQEKEYTWGYKYRFDYNIHLAEVELEVGYIPGVGNLFPR